MMLNKLVDQASTIKRVVHKVLAHPDYIETAVQRGEINPKTGAVGIAFSESWEQRAWLHGDLQQEVDDLPEILHEMVFPMEAEHSLMVSLDAIRLLKAVGVTVVVDIDLDSPKPYVAHGVFQAGKKTKLSF